MYNETSTYLQINMAVSSLNYILMITPFFGGLSLHSLTAFPRTMFYPWASPYLSSLGHLQVLLSRPRARPYRAQPRITFPNHIVECSCVHHLLHPQSPLLEQRSTPSPLQCNVDRVILACHSSTFCSIWVFIHNVGNETSLILFVWNLRIFSDTQLGLGTNLQGLRNFHLSPHWYNIVYLEHNPS